MTESQFSQIVNNDGRYVQVNNNRGTLDSVAEKPLDPKPKNPVAQNKNETKPSVMLSTDFEKALTIERGGQSKDDPTKNEAVAAENKPAGTI
ncbi:MAG: hypothetical protein LBB20_00305 [Puniceicoccales bacterium]|jgi:hypothetical protein|nr:hypothetical protein [Puniceicoccales bacterium]